MNKKERRQADLKRHYEFLERFSEYLGHTQDGKKLSLKLLKIERAANQAAMDYCNGENGVDESHWRILESKYKAAVLAAFGVKEIPGFFINGDPRGYALKIDDAVERELTRKYQEQFPHGEPLGFHRDMGGYGILSPEIGG